MSAFRLQKQPWALLLALACLSVAIPAQANVTYLHTDIQGTVVLETDQNRNVVQRFEYEPYGLPRQTMDDRPGYTGHVHDADSGLVYMQQRYYDPEVGRFLSIDPVSVNAASGANFNRYWYGNNNPYTFVDPDGREVRCTATACTMTPLNQNLPSVTYPRPEGHPDVIGHTEGAYHEYRVDEPAGTGDSAYGQRLQEALVANPTPDLGVAATPEGTRIDANASGDISPFVTRKDHVLSFVVDVPGGGQGVVNVTLADHAGHPGVVLRMIGSDGAGGYSVINYGEGNSIVQKIGDTSNEQATETWRRNSRYIISQAKQ